MLSLTAAAILAMTVPANDPPEAAAAAALELVAVPFGSTSSGAVGCGCRTRVPPPPRLSWLPCRLEAPARGRLVAVV